MKAVITSEIIEVIHIQSIGSTYAERVKLIEDTSMEKHTWHWQSWGGDHESKSFDTREKAMSHLEYSYNLKELFNTKDSINWR